MFDRSQLKGMSIQNRVKENQNRILKASKLKQKKVESEIEKKKIERI